MTMKTCPVLKFFYIFHFEILCCPGWCFWFCFIWTLRRVTLKLRCLKWMSVAMVLGCCSPTRSFKFDTNAESNLFSDNSPPVLIAQLTYTIFISFHTFYRTVHYCVYILILCVLFVYYHCHFMKISGKLQEFVLGILKGCLKDQQIKCEIG